VLVLDLKGRNFKQEKKTNPEKKTKQKRKAKEKRKT